MLKRRLWGSFLVVFLMGLGGLASAADLKEWTFLVYMNADNDLYPYALKNIAQMESVGSTDRVNFVVQLDPEPQGAPTVRMLMQKSMNSQPGQISSPVVASLGETDSGDFRTLAQFLLWGAKNYPAKHYAVIIWNHGAGWFGVSADDSPQHIMKIPEVRLALEPLNAFLTQQRGQNTQQAQVDILNFDACLMASFEVAYELRKQARFLVGSQFVEPGDGENYVDIMTLANQPNVDGKLLAQGMVYSYVKQYAALPLSMEARGFNYIALDLSRVEPMVQFFEEISRSVILSGDETRMRVLQNFRNPAPEEGFDLISGVEGVLKGTSATQPGLGPLAYKFLRYYGYPADGIIAERKSNGKDYLIFKTEPGAIVYRTAGGEWQRAEMQKSPVNGMFGALIPGSVATQGFEYAYVRADGTRDAITKILGSAASPVIFHTNFPPTSPVLADGYNLATKGAHGLSLYALSALTAAHFGHQAVAGEIVKEYRHLQFAAQGAPSWTQLFGF